MVACKRNESMTTSGYKSRKDKLYAFLHRTITEYKRAQYIYIYSFSHIRSTLVKNCQIKDKPIQRFPVIGIEFHTAAFDEDTWWKQLLLVLIGNQN